MRIANAIFAVLFVLSAVVQFNDPDPIRWAAMYAAAASICVAWEFRRFHRAAPAVVGGLALVWGVAIALGTHLTAPFGEALTDWSMHAGGSEELRESLGLFLAAGWMFALTARPKR